MVEFIKRREAFEGKFAHDEALRFKAIARRNSFLGCGLHDSLANQGQKPKPMLVQLSWLISRNPEMTTSSKKSSAISIPQASAVTRVRCAAPWRSSWSVLSTRSKPAYEPSEAGRFRVSKRSSSR